MNILFIADVFGQPGREALVRWLPGFRDERAADFVLVLGHGGATPAPSLSTSPRSQRQPSAPCFTCRARLRCGNVSTAQSPGVDTMAATISRDHVAWNGRRFDFSTALTVMLELDDGMWCYDCPSLGLLGCASSPDDAIARFESEFAFLWDEIASESDDALLSQAQDLKRRLRRLVSSVREAA